MSPRPKGIQSVESAARGQCAWTPFFVSEMFKGDVDVQIEQYFTFQVTEMQITFTSPDLR
jgi:hypothetical protein